MIMICKSIQECRILKPVKSKNTLPIQFIAYDKLDGAQKLLTEFIKKVFFEFYGIEFPLVKDMKFDVSDLFDISDLLEK